MKNIHILLILLSIFLTACGKSGKIYAPTPLSNFVATSRSEFYPYLNEYFLDQQSYLGYSTPRKTVYIDFGKMQKANSIGECNISGNNRTIFIKSEFWFNPKTTYYDKLVLIYHELGHCLLDLPHSEGTIMNDYLISSGINDYNIDYYKSEFFALVK